MHHYRVNHMAMPCVCVRSARLASFASGLSLTVMVCVMGKCDVLINVDWYSLSCHLRQLDTPPFLPSGWVAQPMGRTAVWGQRVYVMNPEGVKVGTVLMEPISPIIKSDRAIVEVSNVFLYRDDFHAMLDVLLSCYPLEVDNVQRCDLCADFMMEPSKWAVVQMLEDGRAYLKGIRRGVVWWGKESRNRKPHQLSWGGKDSAFKWKLYNKHKELWEGGMCSKPYIEDAWREVGFEPTRVWRLEVSVTSVAGLEGLGLVVSWYREWFDRCVEIYRGIYGDKFVIREDQGHADRRDDDILHFLDLSGSKILKHRKRKESEVEVDVERRIVCKLWKEFVDPEVRCNAFAMDGLRNHILYMFQKYSCVSAVCRRFKITEGEVMALIENLPSS